jgi:hypothetical protein
MTVTRLSARIFKNVEFSVPAREDYVSERERERERENFVDNQEVTEGR